MPEGKVPILSSKSGYINTQQILSPHGGCLTVLENNLVLPFHLERVYCISGLNEHTPERGRHAHHTLWQIMTSVSGSCDVVLDDGCTVQTIRILPDGWSILLGPLLWHSMKNFSRECVLMVGASDIYREEDYIRDYSAFLAAAGKNRK